MSSKRVDDIFSVIENLMMNKNFWVDENWESTKILGSTTFWWSTRVDTIWGSTNVSWSTRIDNIRGLTKIWWSTTFFWVDDNLRVDEPFMVNEGRQNSRVNDGWTKIWRSTRVDDIFWVDENLRVDDLTFHFWDFRRPNKKNNTLKRHCEPLKRHCLLLSLGAPQL